MPHNKEEKIKKVKFLKSDKIHYIIYKHLDSFGLSMPYEYATEIVTELKKKKLIY